MILSYIVRGCKFVYDFLRIPILVEFGSQTKTRKRKKRKVELDLWNLRDQQKKASELRER